MDGAITALITTLSNLSALYAVEVAPKASGASLLGNYATYIFGAFSVLALAISFANGDITGFEFAQGVSAIIISVSLNVVFSEAFVFIGAGGPAFLIAMIFASLVIDYLLNELISYLSSIRYKTYIRYYADIKHVQEEITWTL